MGKNTLALDPRMSVEAHIEDVARWSKDHTARHYKGPGDMDCALERAANSVGVSRHLFWSLRYEKPSDMLLSSFLKLKLAQLINEEHMRERKRLQDEIERAKASGISGVSIDAALALVSARDEGEG